MYLPAAFNIDDRAEVEAMVRAAGAGDLVTAGADGVPTATRLPILWDGDQRLVAHMARANPHWHSLEAGVPALVVVNGPDAYISPSWYPAKAEHGKVVPTWNYTSVHLIGTAVVHDDAEWTRRVVTALTNRHESPRRDPWAVTDAPDGYIDAMLRAIVGIEVRVDHVEAKAKLSQNRSLADQRGVVDGLRERDPADPIAAAMATRLDGPGAASRPAVFCSACGAPLARRPPVRCGACGAEHWHNPKPCANAIVRDGDRILLARRAQAPWRGGWGSPGGFCEAGEHPADTAVREVREETGLDVEIDGYLGVWVDEYSDSPGADDNETINVAYYVARPVGGDLDRHDPAEVSELGWFPLDRLPDPLAPPDTLAAVLGALRRWNGSPPLDRPGP